MDRNGGIPPGDINSFMDDVKLRQARINNKVIFPEPNRNSEIEEEINQQNSKSDFKIGSYVYLDRESKTFQKSFELKVSLRWQRSSNAQGSFLWSKTKHFCMFYCVLFIPG